MLFKMKIGLFFAVSSVFWTCSYSCTTPLGQQSQCISLYDCPQLLDAFNGQITGETARFLRLSQCGFDGFTPRVCCGPLPSVHETSTTQRPTYPSWPSDNTNSGNTETSNEDSAPAQQCGVDNADRIYGGQITDIDEFPWMALMGYRTRGGSITYQCGGVLINRRYVLTAAHCVTGKIEKDVGTLATVKLGEYDTHQEVDCVDGQCAPPPQDIPVERAFPHSGFSDKNVNRRDDIALVRLSRRAQLSDYVQPICLVNNNARINTGDSVYVAGWGKTLSGKNSPVKLKLGMPIFDKTKCLNKYQPLGAQLTDRQLCAGGNFAQDSCRGDSGGPLMKRGPSSWEVVGVVSFGNGCGRDGWPGVYTSVAAYDDWIRSTLRSSNH